MPTPWDPFIEELVQNVKDNRCGLFGSDRTPWTDIYEFNADEMKRVFAGFTDPASLHNTPLKIDGLVFVPTRTSATEIVLELATEGLIAVRTAKTFIVCRFVDTTITPTRALVAVQACAERLAAIGL
jgi:hypothetical protein